MARLPVIERMRSGFPIPLLDDQSQSVESRMFHVFPGQVAVVRAYGFMPYKERVDDTETQVTQVACLQSVIFEESALPDYDSCQGLIVDFSKYKGQVKELDYVYLDGCGVEVSACNNHILINIPGSYRFVLNDETAVGMARIYVTIMDRGVYTWESKLFVGE